MFVRDEVERAGNKRTILLPMPSNERLRHVAERLLKSPDDPADLDSLAVDAHMSRRNFTRSFKEETRLPVAHGARLRGSFKR
jgi:transcriptional regulator GlxA family with amidase domain